MNKYAGVVEAIQKLEIVINGTPTGETRNILTDVNIFLHSLESKPEPVKSAEEIFAENKDPKEIKMFKKEEPDLYKHILRAMESYRNQPAKKRARQADDISGMDFMNDQTDDRIQKAIDWCEKRKEDLSGHVEVHYIRGKIDTFTGVINFLQSLK